MSISSLGLTQLFVLFTLVVTLHVVEEMLWLPDWSQDAGRWHEPVTTAGFAVASIVHLLVVYGVVTVGVRSGPESVGSYLACGLVLVMLVNVLIPHVAATVSLRRYAPGVFTAVMFVLPLAPIILFEAWRDGFISMPRFGFVGLVLVVVTAVMWPIVLEMGMALSRNLRP